MKIMSTLSTFVATAAAATANGIQIATKATVDATLASGKFIGAKAGDIGNAACQARHDAKTAYAQRRAILHRAAAIKANAETLKAQPVVEVTATEVLG